MRLQIWISADVYNFLKIFMKLTFFFSNTLSYPCLDRTHALPGSHRCVLSVPWLILWSDFPRPLVRFV